MRKSTKNTKKNVQPQQPQFDAQARFTIGEIVEISTDMGWVDGTVTKVNRVDSGDIHGYHYNVHYVPRWDKSGKGGLTVVTGPAVRAK